MAIYKVVLKGSCQGQAINNILYYRNGIGVDISGLTVGGTKEVADAVKAIVWTGLKEVLPDSYQLQQIDSYVYGDQDFNLIYQNPYTVGVQENGLIPVDTHPMNGPAPCAILKFILESHVALVNGIGAPKRGYLAIGPIVDDWIEDDGSLKLDTPRQLIWDAVCAVMANNVETILPIPAVFFPIRVHMFKVGPLFPLKIVGWADIQAAVMRHFCSYRRSRQPEN